LHAAAVEPRIAAMHPASAPVFTPVQLDLPVASGPDEPAGCVEEEELLLTVEPSLILVPPLGAGEIPTIDPFSADVDAAVVPFPGPSLFERIAMAARNRTWDQPPAERYQRQWSEPPLSRVA
jgi:hypothetical protein